MSDRNAGGRFLALATLAGAIISSPLVFHLFTRGSISSTGPTVPQIIEIRWPASMDSRMNSGSPGNSLLDPTTVPGPPQVRPQVITIADLDKLSNWELDVLRNEPYARHGRRFNRPDLQAHFDRQPWYTPRYGPNAFPEELLTPDERALSEWVADYQHRVRRTR